MLTRMIRAARLDSQFYEMVEADSAYTRESAMVVLLASLAGGLGLMFSQGQSAKTLIVGIIAVFISWLVWSGITLLIGTRVTRGPNTESNMGEMLRVLGYAHTPRLLSFFVFIPILGPILAFVGALWSLAAGIVAIRQALDFSTGRAVITVVLGWVVIILINAVTMGLLGIHPGAGLS